MTQRKCSVWCAALKIIPAQWRADFVRFLDGEDVRNEFLTYLESSRGARRACETILRDDRAMAQLMAVGASSTTRRK